MLFGGTVRQIDDVKRLRMDGFDFGEIAFLSSRARHYWWESGLSNNGSDKFFLIAHGPHEETEDDIAYLKNKHIPGIKATIDILCRMNITSLNIHMAMDKSVSRHVIDEKIKVLGELVEYARKNNVLINLENISESVEELEPAIAEISNLGLTLDTGHANLDTLENKSISIVRNLGKSIRHCHFHDNLGGHMPHGDLHLPVGKGNIDFKSIVRELLTVDYKGTVTFEASPELQAVSMKNLETIIKQIRGISNEQ